MVYVTVLFKGLLIRKVISKSNTLLKVLLFLKYKYDLPYSTLNKYYFSSANRLPRKNMGHKVSAGKPTHAQNTSSDCCLWASAYGLASAGNMAGMCQRSEIT